MFDCHVHSSFSGDSEMHPDDAISQAIHLGLQGIAFTDHLDIDYPDFDEKFLIDFKKYSQTMDDLKDKYSGKLKVLKGIEVGIQPHVVDETRKTVESYDFDMVIASVHIIDKMDPYTGKYFIGKSKNEAFIRYLECILDSVTLFHNFDVIGHIGYIRRYCNYDDRSLSYKDYGDLVDSILKTVISKGKGIEVNTSGFRPGSGLGTTIPEIDIIKRYKELGGEIICLGSDAHYPEHIALSFDKARDLLSTVGFRYITHFEKRKAVFDAI
ncbi:MAG: histidinol-phosphatase HisJ family protein [Clostridia bacterium]|nr:histidinol-phosphatase HisJ family protein [Clostridia bacterium]